MMNKRNSKVLKALSTAIVGSIAIGNCSTVWMMENNSIKEARHSKIKASIIDAFIGEEFAFAKEVGKFPELSREFVDRALNISDKIFDILPRLNNDINGWSNIIVRDIITGTMKNRSDEQIVNIFFNDCTNAGLNVSSLPGRSKNVCSDAENCRHINVKASIIDAFTSREFAYFREIGKFPELSLEFVERILNMSDKIFSTLPYLNNDINGWSRTIVRDIITGTMKNIPEKEIVNIFFKDYLDASLYVSNLYRHYLDEPSKKNLDNYLSEHPMKTINGDKKALELYKEEICNFLAGKLKKDAAVIEQLSNDDLELIDKKEGAKSVFVRMFVHRLCDVRTALSRCN